MIIDITESFSEDVNMDPDLGSETCSTYLIFDPDVLYDDKISLQLINFDLNISNFLDELRKDNVMNNILKDVTYKSFPSLFCNMPVIFKFTGIKGFDICIVNDKQNRIYKSSNYKLKQGDIRYRLSGESAFSNDFIILNLIGNMDAKAFIDFDPNDCIYSDIKSDNILYNQCMLEKIKNQKWEEFANDCYKEKTKMFDIDFCNDFFHLSESRAIKDEK